MKTKINKWVLLAIIVSCLATGFGLGKTYAAKPKVYATYQGRVMGTEWGMDLTFYILEPCFANLDQNFVQVLLPTNISTDSTIFIPCTLKILKWEYKAIVKIDPVEGHMATRPEWFEVGLEEIPSDRGQIKNIWGHLRPG